MKLELAGGWKKKLKRQIEGFEFEVGILEDQPHKVAKETTLFGTPDLGTYAGGPVRKIGKGVSGMSVGEVLIENMKRLNINILREPFKLRNSEIIKFTTYFLKLATKQPGVSVKRIENLLQAIVRNPILRQEYGENKASTADAKGFDRHLFDTGQMFKNIKAKVKRRV